MTAEKAKNALREQLVIGQRVYVRRATYGGRPPEMMEASVSKIGRTLVTLEWGDRYTMQDQFYMETGYQRSDYSPMRFLTEQQLEAESRIDAARQRLAAAGVRLVKAAGYSGEASLSVDQWEAVADALDRCGAGDVA